MGIIKYALECTEGKSRISTVSRVSVNLVNAGSPTYFMAVTFDAAAQGQLAMAIYEWQDSKYLGKVTIGDDSLPVSGPQHEQ